MVRSLFGWQADDDGVDRRVLRDMKKIYSWAHTDLGVALANEFLNRHDMLEMPILVGSFIEECYYRFWNEPTRPVTLAAFREARLDLLRGVWLRSRGRARGRGRKPAEASGKSTSGGSSAGASSSGVPHSGADTSGDGEIMAHLRARHGYYAEALGLDLERLQLYPEAHNRLRAICEAGAVGLFPDFDEEVHDRAERMLLARLHGLMRACVWHIEQL